MEEEKQHSKTKSFIAHVAALIAWYCCSIAGGIIEGLLIGIAWILPPEVAPALAIQTASAFTGFLAALYVFEKIGKGQNTDLLCAIISTVSILDGAAAIYIGSVDRFWHPVITICLVLLHRHQQGQKLLPFKQIAYSLAFIGAVFVAVFGFAILHNDGAAQDNGVAYSLSYANGCKISVAAPKSVIKVGEEIQVIVSHNRSGSNVFINARFADTGSCLMSHSWDRYSSTFTFEGSDPGTVYLQFWYYPFNNSDNGTIYSDIIRLEVVE